MDFLVIDPERFIGPPSFEECMAGVERRIAEDKSCHRWFNLENNESWRSLASVFVQNVATQRNPQGSERYWQNFAPIVYHPENAQRLANNRGLLPEDCPYIEQTNPGILAVCAAEIGFALAIIIAAVETAVYTILTATSLLGLSCSPNSLIFWSNRLKSSSFTILWAASYVVFFNIFVRNVITHENYAYERFSSCLGSTERRSREALRLSESADMVWQQRYIWESCN